MHYHSEPYISPATRRPTRSCFVFIIVANSNVHRNTPLDRDLCISICNGTSVMLGFVLEERWSHYFAFGSFCKMVWYENVNPSVRSLLHHRFILHGTMYVGFNTCQRSPFRTHLPCCKFPSLPPFSPSFNSHPGQHTKTKHPHL